MNPKRTAAFVTISLIWGSGWLTQQAMMSAEDQLRFSVLSYGLCALILGVVGALLRLPLPSLKETVTNVILGGTLVALPYLLTMRATSQVSPGLAIIIVSAIPLVTAFLWDAPWSARNAAIAGIGGVTLVVADLVSASTAQFAGVVALLLGLAATAGSLVFAKRRLAGSYPIVAAAMQLAVAAAVLQLASILSGPKQAFSPHGNLPWMMIVLSCAGNCIAYPLYYWLLRHIRPDQLACVVWGQFLVSVLESVLLLRPHIPWRLVAGMVVVVASLVILARSGQENKMLTVGVTQLPR